MMREELAGGRKILAAAGGGTWKQHSLKPLRCDTPCCTAQGRPAAFASCADVVLVVEGRRLPVHSQILASQSAFFANMWTGASSMYILLHL